MTNQAAGAKADDVHGERYAEAVRTLRGERSTRAFAAEVGVDQSTISRWLKRDDRPNAPSRSTHTRLIAYARGRGRHEQLSALEEAWDVLVGRPAENDFERMFGREIAQGQVLLVSPVIRVNEKVVQPHLRDNDDLFLKLTSGEAAGVGISTPLLAQQDQKAFLTVERMLSLNGAFGTDHMSDDEFTRKADGQLERIPASAFLFGLYSNDVTRLYAERNDALFTIVSPGVNGSPGEIVADGHHFRNHAPHSYPTYFVIARVLPTRAENPERVCIFCGGTNATGTQAAGEFLSDDWKWFSRFAPDADFAAIYEVATENSEPALQLLKATPAEPTTTT